MFCKNCGNQLQENAQFCHVCGIVLSEAEKPIQNVGNTDTLSNAKNSNNKEFTDNSNGNVQPTQGEVVSFPVTQSDSGSVPIKKTGGNKGLVALLVIIALLAIGAVAWFIIAGKTDENTGSEREFEEAFGQTEDEALDDEVDEIPDDEEENEDEVIEVVEKPDIEGSVNKLIAENNLEGQVAVAVLDNTTEDVYLSDGATDTYSAWGFYLPVYMAFCDEYPDGYRDYKDDILSNDAGRCNNAANFAIDSFGGPRDVTKHLFSMGYRGITIGRRYGDVNAGTDNYTDAESAVRLIGEFRKEYDYRDLCYNPATYGVEEPLGASLHAQIGTENINEKKNLNVFAVVKGDNSDYCIVVLTKENASGTGIIDDILDEVHTLMECDRND